MLFSQQFLFSVWAHTRHTPGTHKAHDRQAHIMHMPCTCHAMCKKTLNGFKLWFKLQALHASNFYWQFFSRCGCCSQAENTQCGRHACLDLTLSLWLICFQNMVVLHPPYSSPTHKCKPMARTPVARRGVWATPCQIETGPAPWAHNQTCQSFKRV